MFVCDLKQFVFYNAVLIKQNYVSYTIIGNYTSVGFDSSDEA